MKEKASKTIKLLLIGLTCVLGAGLFFVLLSTTVESVLRLLDLVVTLNFEEENAGKELGKGISLVLIVGLFSIVVTKHCWSAFRRGLHEDLADHPED